MTEKKDAASGAGSGQRRRPGKVLIVDDEAQHGEALRKLLCDENAVTVVTSGKAALALLRDGARFDVVLCDLLMPEMTGMDLHAALTGELPSEAQRIVFMTGGITLPHINAFLDRVSNLCLEKPFDIAALRALIDRRVSPDDESDVAKPSRP